MIINLENFSGLPKKYISRLEKFKNEFEQILKTQILQIVILQNVILVAQIFVTQI